MPSWIPMRAELVLAAVLCVAGPAAAGAEAEARLRLKSAQQAYDLAKFDEALQAYSDAYALDPRPPFLFNIAQCHRQLGNYERAAFFYRRYLDLSPKRPTNAGLVEGLIQEVEARQAEELRQRRLRAEGVTADKPPESALAPQAAPVQPLAAAPGAEVAQEEPSIVTRWWFWTSVGVVAAAAAGTSLYLATRPAGTTLEPIHVR